MRGGNYRQPQWDDALWGPYADTERSTMSAYIVTVRSASGREREYRIVASTETSACSQALLRVQRETGAPKGEWQCVKALPDAWV